MLVRYELMLWHVDREGTETGDTLLYLPASFPAADIESAAGDFATALSSLTDSPCSGMAAAGIHASDDIDSSTATRDEHERVATFFFESTNGRAMQISIPAPADIFESELSWRVNPTHPDVQAFINEMTSGFFVTELPAEILTEYCDGYQRYIPIPYRESG